MQLEILTKDQQVAGICEDYWLQDEDGKFVLKVREIAVKHEVKAHIISQYVKQHAYVWSASICCRSCEEPCRFSTRIQYQERNRYAGSICQKCSEAARKKTADQKRNILIELRQEAANNKPDLATLDLKSIIYLLAIIHALSNEDLSAIAPLNDYPYYTLSPDPIFDRYILRHLIDKHLLLISLDSSPEAVEFAADGTASISFVMSTFDFALDQQDMSKLIHDFLDTEVLQNIKHSPELIELCKEIQLQECLAFLKVKLEEHQFDFSPGEKTQHTLRQCLKTFSVAQTYNFLWRAARDAAAYYMRSYVSKRQAANTVVRSISRSLEQALANDWNVTAFSRNYDLPQSSLSHIVFNVLLGTDDGGFKQPLHELLQETDTQQDDEQKNDRHDLS